ncbi:hypothetical protein [Halomonas sp. 707D4]|uniref:hypothetical protein n=1 Tax=Halomonas sp. 707D4 TaxID=1904455 RepID=UPI0020A030CF|nr:hypothetical protein [Halomonas sp. 707D4]
MTPEVTRRHYLDAMGITAWACRYQLPGAAPTPACEWEEPTQAVAPRQQLHALLDEPSPPAPARAPGADTATRSAKSARALLGDIALPEQASEAPAPIVKTPSAPESAPPAEPVVFTMTCLCIAGRWLSLHPGELTALEQRLLGNLLAAAGVLDGALPAPTIFAWPPMAGVFTPEDPLEEAREGLAAFVAGAARRQGWQLERLLWWGDEDDAAGTLATVLDLNEQRSHTLELPLWRAPSLATLTQGSAAKRALWPALARLADGAKRTP